MSEHATAPLDFYFDFSSPYGYLLAEKIDPSPPGTAVMCAGTPSSSA